MTTKFTPGPWVLYPDYSGACDGFVESPTGCIVDNICKPENGYLIAAAPDLYAALEAFVNFKSDGTTSVTDDDQLWLKAEQALAKARGE